MKLIIYLIAVSLLASCSKDHDEVYVFNEQAYSSTTTSHFAFAHYKVMANSNVLIIKDTDTKYDKLREQELENLCFDYSMNCSTIDMTNFNLDSVQNYIENFNSFDGEKFLLVAASNILRAKFIGLIHLIEKSGDLDSLQKILNELKLEESDIKSTTDEIIKVQKEYLESK